MLDFNVRGENIAVTDSLREYVEKRLTKLNRYIEETANANINLRTYQSNNSGKAEVTIVLPYVVLRAEDTNPDLYTAIDAVSEKLERQIRKYKTKINRKSRETGFKGIDSNDEIPATDVDDDSLQIVRRKQVDLKPMSPEEAALQMDLLEHNFFIFKDAESNTDSVIYKRADGKYGLLETE
ncbi:ribosome-associated translation inhibitor RaiA [Leuconostoc carnosum]|uniref:Ribosome hibernation promoting factor n=2 Tax=Leuconostoc carnosum TaxID=1252 RepID=K0D8I4_LEUCJ|nr:MULTISPECIES: ribosome-associated translation inhibitor RaiA [Leuconostoc]AFT81135.1 ribosome-associated factor Y [Leuconostoc carnosum JB16]KAA8326474.1 ribosome-associated translation inhibitor RaiA [Leuconostoc carnosum]KAA8330732.1 ribosome-associated translation inhibitor RaiA [Leuconostoc carnosum]KAA8362034.1 ribosome-associated translation inhibitor RaiA [Leuconostoc carnosum]KAA8366582.1 ribosome-associated translation inhibitor RaiA [Leuconostoc carnosum]